MMVVTTSKLHVNNVKRALFYYAYRILVDIKRTYAESTLKLKNRIGNLIVFDYF